MENTSFSHSLDYRTKAGLMRGAKISIVRHHAFSWDILKEGKKIGHKRLFSNAQRLALRHVPKNPDYSI